MVVGFNLNVCLTVSPSHTEAAGDDHLIVVVTVCLDYRLQTDGLQNSWINIYLCYYGYRF